MDRWVAWRSAGVLFVLAVLGAKASEAGELLFSADSKVGYDSNLFNGNPDGVESGVIMFRPEAAVRDELERGSYGLEYSPAYFINTSQRAKNTWNHRVLGRGTYHFSPRTSAWMSDSFSYLEKIVYSPSDPDPDANIDDDNRRTTTNNLSVGLNHMITRRLSYFASSSYSIYRYDRKRSEDSDTFGGSTGLSYQLTRQLSVGGGGQASFWSFDSGSAGESVCAPDKGPGSHSLSYSGFASAAYDYDETTRVEVRAGPAWIESTNFLCNSNPISPAYLRRETDQTTWFAEAELLKGWRYVKTSLRYRRSEGSYGSSGQTSVNDSVIGRIDWQPARYWNLELRLGWIHRSQDSPRNPNTQLRENPESNSWTAAFKVTRQIAKRVHVFADASYRNQSDETNLDNPLNIPDEFLPDTGESTFDTWRAFVGISYRFDPIRY